MGWLERSGGMVGGQEWIKCRSVERVDGWRKGSGAVVAEKCLGEEGRREGRRREERMGGEELGVAMEVVEA